MMRSLLLILGLLVAAPAYASDQYIKYAKPVWRTNTKIQKHIRVRSSMVLPKSKIAFIRKIYKLAEQHFFDFTNINPKICKRGKLKVYIVNESELDSVKYFPGEDDYSEPDKKLYVLGRYFRYNNSMYIVPPHLGLYYWRKNFSHELIHYFYDDCGVVFSNDDAEHAEIHKFMRAKSKWFY